jgi:hypothetical protein
MEFIGGPLDGGKQMVDSDAAWGVFEVQATKKKVKYFVSEGHLIFEGMVFSEDEPIISDDSLDLDLRDDIVRLINQRPAWADSNALAEAILVQIKAYRKRLLGEM